MTEKTYNAIEGISVDGIDSPRLPIHREAGAEKRVSSAVATLFLKLDQSGICRATYPVAKPPTALLKGNFIGPILGL